MTNGPFDVLLIEDNPGDALLIREAFKEKGRICNLNVIGDGEKALSFLTDHKAAFKKPDLIILDLNLPGKNGWEILAEIKYDISLKKIPVIIFSSSSDNCDIERSYEFNANCYVQKPGDLESWLYAVNSIADFWFDLVNLPSA